MRSSLSNAPAAPAAASDDAGHFSPSAGRPLDDAFVVERLATGAVGLACLPVFLVIQGAPSAADVMAAAALAAPVPAAFLAARFGQRAAAYALSAAGHALAGALLLCWSVSFAPIALPLALVEAADARLRGCRDGVAAAVAGAAAAAALVALLLLAFPERLPETPLAPAAALLFVLARLAMLAAARARRRYSPKRVNSLGPTPAVPRSSKEPVASDPSTVERSGDARTSASATESLDPTDHFLAAVSHELRTPLNAIIGFSEMLADERHGALQDERRREYAGIIQESGTHLLGIVDTLLDVSRIKSGSFALAREPIDLGGIVEACSTLIAPLADEGTIRLDLRLAPDLPPALADRSAFRQIVLNLLSNAVKFTLAGGTVTVRLRKAGSDAVLTVQDTGIGIPAADLARIGDPFFQGANVYSRGREGTGLGFAVVRGLVDLHGGRLTIESTPGRGTTVTVVLPAWSGRDAMPAPARRPVPRRRPDLAA